MTGAAAPPVPSHLYYSLGLRRYDSSGDKFPMNCGAADDADIRWLIVVSQQLVLGPRRATRDVAPSSHLRRSSGGGHKGMEPLLEVKSKALGTGVPASLKAYPEKVEVRTVRSPRDVDVNT